MTTTTVQPTTTALVTATLALCEQMASEEVYTPYATNILRKAMALQEKPTALYVCQVLDDLRIIACLCGQEI